MPDKPSNPLNFWQELKRRKVVRVIIVYAAASFVILELASIIQEPFGLPDWTVKLVFIILFVGLIITIILSWIYDITPVGIEKTKPSGQNNNKAKQPASIGWKISTYISLLVVIAFVMFYIIGNIKQSSDISKLPKTIAVLPFENFSYGEAYAHYGNSISNEITTELSKIEDFHVVSNTSASQYMPGNKPPIPQIGRELKVNFIIEGSIERQVDNVNIHVQVILADKDDHIWVEEYNGKWKDIHTIQDDIAFEVADELKAKLSPIEIDKIEKIPTENPEAYEYYLRGNEFYSRSYAVRDWNIAINNYQKAIELDPDFALAYIKLAIAHMSVFWFAIDYSLDRLKKGKQAIDAAFKLVPEIPEGYIALGLYYYWGFQDYDEALKQFDRALLYMPNNNDCLYYKGVVFRRMGRFREAIQMMKKALSNDPKSHRKALNLARTYALLNEYNEALKYFDVTINLNPEFATAYNQKAELLLKWEGNTIEARETIEEAALVLNIFDFSILVVRLFKLIIYNGDLNEALTLLNKLKDEVFYSQLFYYPKQMLYAEVYDQMDSKEADLYYKQAQNFLEDKILENPDDPRYYSSLGICYAGLGHKDKALEAGRKAIEIWPINKDALKGVYMLEKSALIHTMVGEFNLALEQLDYLLSNPSDLSANLLQLDPAWKPLWDHPEFKKLIEKYSKN